LTCNALNPDQVSALIKSSLAEFSAGRRDSAMEAAELLADVIPSSEAEWRALIELFQKLDRDLWVEMSTSHFLEVHPDHLAANFELCRLMGKTWHRLPEARALVAKLSTRELDAPHMLMLADAWAAVSNWPNAVACYRNVLQLTPDNAGVRYRLIFAFLKAKDTQAARKELMELASVLPQTASSYSNIVSYAVQIPDRALAAKYADMALALLKPDDDRGRASLLLVTLKFGLWPQANNVIASFDFAAAGPAAFLEKLLSDITPYGTGTQMACEAIARRLTEIDPHKEEYLQQLHDIEKRRSAFLISEPFQPSTGPITRAWRSLTKLF
jgi:tetratricopeptide (TPR) repeat protein